MAPSSGKSSAGGKEGKPKPRTRVIAWLDALKKAGDDMDSARAALNRVRDDARASKADKEHFYRALAQQSLVWFIGAVEGRPLTGDEVKKLATERRKGEPATKGPARSSSRHDPRSKCPRRAATGIAKAVASTSGARARA